MWMATLLQVRRQVAEYPHVRVHRSGMLLDPPSHDILKRRLQNITGLVGAQADDAPAKIHITPPQRENVEDVLARGHSYQEQPLRLVVDDRSQFAEVLWS
jgi:hypothetical protein